MKILYKQTLKDFLSPFLLSVVMLAFIMLMDRMFILADLLVKKGVKLKIIFEIALLSLPYVISYTLPIAVMIAGIVAFGRLTADNELTALKASGINFLTIIKPQIVLTVLIFIIMFFFNGVLWPESEHRVRNLLLDLARKKPQIKIREGVFLDEFGNYTIYIGRLNEKSGEMSNILIFKKEDKKTPVFIIAPKGILKQDEREDYFTFILKNGEVHQLVEEERYRRLSFKEDTINIPFDDELVRRERTYRSTREMNFLLLLKQMSIISKELQRLKKEFRELKKRAKDFEPMAYRLKEEETRLLYKIQEREKYALEFHKKTSLAFATVFFLLFGIALGLVLKKGGIGLAFIAGLIFFAFYYILILAGEELVNRGKIAAWVAMWVPVALPLPFSLYFLWTKANDRALFGRFKKRSYENI